MATNGKNLNTEPYKGTRDFYPEDQFIQDYIFNTWRKVAKAYGYQEYGASILEETELYKSKSGEELVNEQTYSFVDRGGRDVTIRPEMTPTVARMVANKRKALNFPLRWFSIPNLFRYERPQRGRLREHWQLNVDIFGIDSISADVEIIELAHSIMKAFGAKDQQFVIHVNSRKFLNHLLQDYLRLGVEEQKKCAKLLDRRRKLEPAEFEAQGQEMLGAAEFKVLHKLIDIKNLSDLPQELQTHQSVIELKSLITQLEQAGVKNLSFDIGLVRGFDYYTSTVFEIYDTSPKNNRSLFGGGRYDDLVSIFGSEAVSGVGFGMGDVTIRDFLETYDLLPKYTPSTHLYICHLEGYEKQAAALAKDLRVKGLNVALDLSDKKVASQVKTADRERIPFVLVVGEEESSSGRYKVKNLSTGHEQEADLAGIMQLVK